MTNALDRFANRIAKLERNMRAASSSPQLGTSSIENGGAIKDKGPDGTTYQFIGKQFDGTHTVSNMNGPTPPAPTFPGASPAYNAPGMVVSWDGMFEDGAFGPMDLLRVDVHVLDEDHTDPLLYAPAGVLLAGAGGSVSVLLDPGEYWAVLVAWTTSGKYAISGASNLVTVVAPTIELPPPSDGLTPTEAPVVAGQPFAVGAVEFTWAPIANEDDVQYDYWASLTTPVSTAGPPTGFVVSPSVRISRINGVQVPMDGTGEVYIKVAARDMDGLGPVSLEASAQPRSAEVESIIAGFVAALEIEASQIRGQFISADLALLTMLSVGDRLDINGNDSTITIYAADLDSEGNKVPLIILDPIGSEFRGRVIADDISVMNGLILKGQNSQIASDSGVTIMAGVSSPNFGPSLSATLQTSEFLPVDGGFTQRGFAWDATDNVYLRLLVPDIDANVDGGCVVQRFDADGDILSDLTLGNIPGVVVVDMSGIARVGSSYWVNYKVDVSGEEYWNVAKFGELGGDFELVADAAPGLWGAPTFKTLSRPSIGWTTGPTGVDRIISAIWAGTSQYSPGVGYWSGPGMYAVALQADGTRDTGVGQAGFYHGAGGFNNGGVRLDSDAAAGKDSGFAKAYVDGISTVRHLWLGVGKEVRHYTWDGAKYNKVTTDSLALQGSIGKGGIADRNSGNNLFYDLYSVHETAALLYHYSSYAPLFNEKLWATFANTDGTYVTLDSPASSIAVPRGRFVQVSLPPDSLGAKVYAGLGPTLPADANLDERLETLTASRTMLIDPTVAGGAGSPPGANTFPGGLSGWIKSQTGGLELTGDGNLKAPKKIQTNEHSITPSGVDVWTSLTVNFPVPFDVVPKVVTDVNNTGSSATMTSKHSDVTASQVKLWIRSSTVTAKTVSYIAMVP